MGISISGISSGLPPNIVEQLMEVEKIPIKSLETKKGKLDETQKLVVDLESKVTDITKNISELLGTRGFLDMKLLRN